VATQLTNSQAGRIIGWGTGQTLGEVTKTIKLTADLTGETVKNWASQGLTREWVAEQLTFYREKISDVTAAANCQLVNRAALMEKILSLWPQ
jgi:hypothetical protein